MMKVKCKLTLVYIYANCLPSSRSIESLQQEILFYWSNRVCKMMENFPGKKKKKTREETFSKKKSFIHQEYYVLPYTFTFSKKSAKNDHRNGKLCLNLISWLIKRSMTVPYSWVLSCPVIYFQPSDTQCGAFFFILKCHIKLTKQVYRILNEKTLHHS